jgi:hypothetical protein
VWFYSHRNYLSIWILIERAQPSLISLVSLSGKRSGEETLRAIRHVKRPRAVYDAINLRVSQLISSVTKSRSGHEFSRAHIQKYRARARENFWFQFSGL